MPSSICTSKGYPPPPSKQELGCCAHPGLSPPRARDSPRLTHMRMPTHNTHAGTCAQCPSWQPYEPIDAAGAWHQRQAAGDSGAIPLRLLGGLLLTPAAPEGHRAPRRLAVVPGEPMAYRHEEHLRGRGWTTCNASMPGTEHSRRSWCGLRRHTPSRLTQLSDPAAPGQPGLLWGQPCLCPPAPTAGCQPLPEP